MIDSIIDWTGQNNDNYIIDWTGQNNDNSIIDWTGQNNDRLYNRLDWTKQ